MINKTWIGWLIDWLSRLIDWLTDKLHDRLHKNHSERMDYKFGCSLKRNINKKLKHDRLVGWLIDWLDLTWQTAWSIAQESFRMDYNFGSSLKRNSNNKKSLSHLRSPVSSAVLLFVVVFAADWAEVDVGWLLLRAVDWWLLTVDDDVGWLLPPAGRLITCAANIYDWLEWQRTERTNHWTS